jgi:hypothetical protein
MENSGQKANRWRDFGRPGFKAVARAKVKKGFC